MAPLLFRDRTDAGAQLAARLESYANRSDVVVLGLPRGGVPVASEVAKALNVPLDVCVVRKLGVPGQEELAMGAIADNICYLNRAIVERCRVSAAVIEQVTQQERQELERRQRIYGRNRSPIDLCGRTVILVDDGLATGATMIAAVEAVKRRSPSAIVVSVPVAASETCRLLSRRVDSVISATQPKRLRAIGLWYEDFSQTTDEEVRDLLRRPYAEPNASEGKCSGPASSSDRAL